MKPTKRPRGRPPRIARDVAVMCAVEWFKGAERQPAVAATRHVRELWRNLNRKGLGDPASDSPVVFERIRRATARVGAGRFVVMPGVEVGENVRDAAVYYVVEGSTFHRPSEVGGNGSVVGACWRWPFAAEEAEFLSDGTESPSVGVGRAGAASRVPRAGTGPVMSGP